MLKIRLTRVGKRNQPSFRIILTEHSWPVKGKFIEILGNYNPRLKTRAFKKERILYWLSKGAKASPTVHNLLVSEKIIPGPKVKASKIKKTETQEIKTDQQQISEQIPAQNQSQEQPSPEQESSQEQKLIQANG